MDRAMHATIAEPLYQRLKRFVLASKVVGTDDTPVEVLDRKFPDARKARIWPYVGDRDHVAAGYDYTPRGNEPGPKLLKQYRGHLQADAYVAYDAFFTKPERGMAEVGCWAQARRHFHQALESDPSRMRTLLLLITQLRNVERKARERDLHGEPLRLLREHRSQLVLERLQAYLLEIQDQLLPKSEAASCSLCIEKLDSADAVLRKSGSLDR
jgi:transposase